jgi:hypothetical protein
MMDTTLMSLRVTVYDGLFELAITHISIVNSVNLYLIRIPIL